MDTDYVIFFITALFVAIDQWNTEAFDTPFVRELSETNGTLQFILKASSYRERSSLDRVRTQN